MSWVGGALELGGRGTRAGWEGTRAGWEGH